MPLPRRLRSFSLRTLMVLVGVACVLSANNPDSYGGNHAEERCAPATSK
jgi:hypothetical protein